MDINANNGAMDSMVPQNTSIVLRPWCPSMTIVTSVALTIIAHGS